MIATDGSTSLNKSFRYTDARKLKWFSRTVAKLEKETRVEWYQWIEYELARRLGLFSNGDSHSGRRIRTNNSPLDENCKMIER